MLYAVYLPYSKYEVLNDEDCNDPTIPKYPPHISRLRVYDNKFDQLNCYTNTMCPASQCIDAETEEELNIKVTEMQANFANDSWVKEHIDPYV